VLKKGYQLHLIDPSAGALAVAKKTLAGAENCHFYESTIEGTPISAGSMDFGYSLGVLHHVPNTNHALRHAVEKLKVGSPFLLYLYYSLDNRPWWFRALFKVAGLGRLCLSQLPLPVRHFFTDMIAIWVYFPLAKTSKILEKLHVDIENFPLAFYRNSSFYTMRTDAFDRFATRLEKRFSKAEVEHLMKEAGLENIVFNDTPPFWTAVGFRK
jgi:SAM-dependent methyltransferase